MSSTQPFEATTTATSDKCIYKWTIKNYRLIKTKAGESISSPKFCVGKDDKKYFKLNLYPEGYETAGFISLFLTYEGTDSTKELDKLICRSKISVINDKEVVHHCVIHENFIEDSGWGQLKFFELKNIEKLISSQNTVTIQCELEMFKEYESLLDQNIISNEDEKMEEVKFNLPFLNEEFSDVEFTTSDKKSISAHKFILAMASPVFKAMFAHDILENKKNSVEITDVPHNILVEMLRYIYTGEIANTTTDIILKLLSVSDKYQIDNLKSRCGKILCAELCYENAIEILIAAHKYNAKNLKVRILKFVTDNIQSLVNSEQLNQINDPDILLDIIRFQNPKQ